MENFRKRPLKTSVLALLLASTLLAVGCDSPFEEKEMKGYLTVDHKQWANHELEVRSLEGVTTRFIHPGKKIVEFMPGRIGKYDLTMYDSRRVKLIHFEIPHSAVDLKSQTVHARAQDIHQDFDLVASRKRVTVRIDYVKKRGDSCVVKNCKKKMNPKTGEMESRACQGVIGGAWQIEDYRYDYVLKFVNRANGEPMAVFIATGQTKTNAQTTDVKTCQVRSTTYADRQEAFQ